MCINIHTHKCVCVCVSVCCCLIFLITHVWKVDRSQCMVPSSITLSLIFWVRLSYWAWTATLARLTGQWTPEVHILQSLSAGVTGLHYHVWLLSGYWGSEVRSFCLHSKFCTHWTIFQVLYLEKSECGPHSFNKPMSMPVSAYHWTWVAAEDWTQDLRLTQQALHQLSHFLGPC